MTNSLKTFLELNIEDMEITEKNKELEQAIEDKFLTSSKFSSEIERVVLEENCNYIDAICHYCEVNGIDIESVTKLVSKPLKERLKNDAISLNFMRRISKAKLPL
jgi:folate-dependent tRNA-U54 methylase TrmFO/GidA